MSTRNKNVGILLAAAGAVGAAAALARQPPPPPPFHSIPKAPPSASAPPVNVTYQAAPTALSITAGTTNISPTNIVVVNGQSFIRLSNYAMLNYIQARFNGASPSSAQSAVLDAFSAYAGDTRAFQTWERYFTTLKSQGIVGVLPPLP